MTTSIQSERQRQNGLMKVEARVIAWLCARMPDWVTPNRLTTFGLMGAGVILTSLLLGKENRWWLLGGIIGLAIHWLGDSLDGRLAYYRRRPRKWFGFVLDVLADWASLCTVSMGFVLYLPRYEFLPILFMAIYGSGMLIATLRYKITNCYRIDSGKFGPTEMRLVVAGILLVEIALPQSVILFGGVATLMMLISDVVELRKLLRTADRRDRAEAREFQVKYFPQKNFLAPTD
jgi:phosphatidylglycerophosphate synthase